MADDIDVPDLGTADERGRSSIRDEGEEIYSEKVRKRINKEISRRKVSDDRASAAERRSADLERQLHATQQHSAAATERLIETRLQETERVLRSAKEHGDVDAEMKAQREMMSLSVSLDSVKVAKAAAPAAPVARPELSSAMKGWLDDGNDNWFNRDDAMTTTAVGLDKAARRAGIAAESPEYFEFIDRKMKAAFPEHFAADEDDDEPIEVEKPARPVVAAAPARRAVTPGQSVPARTVRLSAEEMEVAKALQMTPQQYAAHKTAK